MGSVLICWVRPQPDSTVTGLTPRGKTVSARAPWGQFSLFLSCKKSDRTDPWRGKTVNSLRPPWRGKTVNPLAPLLEPRSGFCPAAQGCAVPRATLGSGRSAIPTPQGVVPFMPTGWVEQTQAEWNQIRGCGRRVHQEGMSTLHTMSKHHMPPVRSFGTTLSGLFLYPQSTHGSTSAVQPWALWQNPFGIPGG